MRSMVLYSRPCDDESRLTVWIIWPTLSASDCIRLSVSVAPPWSPFLISIEAVSDRLSIAATGWLISCPMELAISARIERSAWFSIRFFCSTIRSCWRSLRRRSKNRRTQTIQSEPTINQTTAVTLRS